MGQLSIQKKRLKKDCIDAVRSAILSRESAYLTIAQWLTVATDEELWIDDEDCHSLEDFAKKYFEYSKSYVSRILAAKQAYYDVVELPIGNNSPQKVGEYLPAPKTEAVARELAVLPTPQARANLWTRASETAPKNKKTDEPKVTARHVASVRKQLFGEKPDPKVDPKLPTCITHLKGLIATIDTVRCRIDDLKKEHRPESQSWQTALDSLDEARKAFARLAR